MDPHRYASIFPPMSLEEFEELCEDIQTHGLREPILTYQRKILDGRHRERACGLTGVQARYEEFEGTELEAIHCVVSLNAKRRHLDSGQRATSAAKMTEFLDQVQRAAKKRQREGGKEAGRGRPKEKVEERIPQPYRKPESRDTIATAVGTNGKYVDAAVKLQKQAPDLFEKVHAGELKIPQAKREMARREKRAALKAKCNEVTAVLGAGPKRDLGWEIITGDFLEVVSSVEFAKPRLIFADPPYNLGINYGDHHHDDLEDDEYIRWANQWIRACANILADDGSLWILISDEYAAEYGCLIKNAGLTIRSWIIWYESFGVNCANKFNRTHRHLFYAVKDPKHFVFNADAVSRPSDRQTKYRDSRAAPSGKIWDDVWGITPAIPRLIDNHPERIPDFPTQLPTSLLMPIVRCASDPGDLVIDPFCGSGTTGAVCIRTDRRFVGIEESEAFADVARSRLLALSGDLIHAS